MGCALPCRWAYGLYVSKRNHLCGLLSGEAACGHKACTGPAFALMPGPDAFQAAGRQVPPGKSTSCPHDSACAAQWSQAMSAQMQNATSCLWLQGDIIGVGVRITGEGHCFPRLGTCEENTRLLPEAGPANSAQAAAQLLMAPASPVTSAMAAARLVGATACPGTVWCSVVLLQPLHD